MQDDRSIAYFSKGLSGQLLTKSTYKKEPMALVLAVQHWRPYHLGGRFLVRIDQRSLKQLLAQTLTTPAQQNWAAKLLGFDFEITYKEGRNNRAADALSRRDLKLELALISTPYWLDCQVLQTVVQTDPRLHQLIIDFEQGKPTPKHYSLSQGTLFYKGHLVLPVDSPWIPKLLGEFHASPAGGTLALSVLIFGWQQTYISPV